jgi:hypothetical protein
MQIVSGSIMCTIRDFVSDIGRRYQQSAWWSTRISGQSHIATDGHSVSKSWYRAPSGVYEQISVTVWQLRSCFLWGALSDQRTGLSFVHAAGPCQRSLSRVRFSWDSRPYFTVWDLRLSFQSPPASRRVTVEVFDATSTWVKNESPAIFHYIFSIRYRTDRIENTATNSSSIVACVFVAAGMCLLSSCLATGQELVYRAVA